MDIHFCVERRRADGSWERAEPLVPASYFIDGYPYPAPGLERKDLYPGRNQVLFQALQEASSLPNGRGLPSDLSQETLAEFEYENDPPDLGGMSWLLLSEIESFDWSREVNSCHTIMTVESDGGKKYEFVSGMRPYSYWCQYFVAHTIPAMQAAGGPEEVRAVFWFNS